MNNRNIIIKKLRGFEVINDSKSIKIFAFTLLMLLVLLTSSSIVYEYNKWFSSLFWIPSGVILCRFFALQHDCGHFSFFSNKKYNKIGGVILGFFTSVPSLAWNSLHDSHHGFVGNLDKRKNNPDVWILTVKEYENSSLLKKIIYRFLRTYFIRLFIVPILWVIASRIPFYHMGIKVFVQILIHNFLYAIIIYFTIVNGVMLEFLFVYLIPLYLFLFLAAIMFYLQHQYEDTYWENDENWDLYEASMHGSSYIKFKPVLRWITGNVGCHPVHHLNTKIPSFELQHATDAVEGDFTSTRIELKQYFKCLRCVLWDESAKKLISFSDLKK